MKKYQIIYADPPWTFRNKKTGGNFKSGASQKYSTLSINDLCALPILKIADDNCILFMWWIASMPQEALDLVKAWGFKLKTMTGFTWIKKTVTGKPFFGMGYYTRQGSENCLIAIKGKLKRCCGDVRSVFENTIEEHSKKPYLVHSYIERLYGNVRKIELFAREHVEGWDAIGNEIDGRDIREVLNGTT